MNLKIRVITSVLTLPLLIFPIFFGGIPMYILVLLLSIIGFYEYLRAYKLDFRSIIFAEICVVIYFCLLYVFGPRILNPFMAILIIMSLLYYVFSFPKIKFKSIGVILAGFFYIVYLLSYIIFVRQFENYGHYFVWFIFLIAFGSDTFAYLVGRRFGKHKLTAISPNKTVEGFIGGICGSILLSLLYGIYIYFQSNMIEISTFWIIALIGGIGAVLAQIGDLVASSIKRQTSVKDFGKILPGHGGILDRFDSNILIAPFIYYLMMSLM